MPVPLTIRVCELLQSKGPMTPMEVCICMPEFTTKSVQNALTNMRGNDNVRRDANTGKYSFLVMPMAARRGRWYPKKVKEVYKGEPPTPRIYVFKPLDRDPFSAMRLALVARG